MGPLDFMVLSKQNKEQYNHVDILRDTLHFAGFY